MLKHPPRPRRARPLLLAGSLAAAALLPLGCTQTQSSGNSLPPDMGVSDLRTPGGTDGNPLPPDAADLTMDLPVIGNSFEFGTPGDAGTVLDGDRKD